MADSPIKDSATQDNAVKKDIWNIPKDALLPDDPLTNCLVLLTRIQHRPFSAQTLIAGLPLESSRLTPELFPRAAARAGLSARVVKRPLEKIADITLPVVLLLKDGGAAILLRNVQDGMVRLLSPEAGAGEAEVPLAEINAQYTGFAIYIKPAFQFDSRSDISFVPRPESWFWGTVKHAWPIYSEVLIASLLINIFALAIPLFTMNVYDRVVPNQTFETLWVLAIGVATVYIFDFVMRTMRGYFIDIAGKKIDVILSANIFEKLQAIRMEARPQSVGAIASSVQEFESFREFITSATITTLVDLPFLILFLLIVWWLGGLVVVPILVAIPLILLVSSLVQRSLAVVVRETFRTSSQRQATLIEALTGLETIKAIGAEGPMQRRWEHHIGYLSKLTLKSRVLSSLATNSAAFFQAMAVVSVIVVGVYLISAKEMTMGALVACTLLTGRALAPLSMIASLLTRFHHAKAALEGINRMMALPVEREPGKSFVNRQTYKGDIEFKNVSFSFPGQQIKALQNVSFHIRAGERVGVLGRIGSGKTTIEKLILGLYQPTEGSIWIDGVDTRQIDPAELRKNIGYVPDEPLLFFGTVRDNIVFGAPYVDDLAVLRAADISCSSYFINRHPQGFDMPIGERGLGLSSGQKQSVAIARGLLLDPPILLFDDPSNSLDNRSEENLKVKLAQHTQGKTLMLITHRASMLTLVDRLIVIDNGRIVADGPKEQILKALSGGGLNVGKN